MLIRKCWVLCKYGRPVKVAFDISRDEALRWMYREEDSFDGPPWEITVVECETC